MRILHAYKIFGPEIDGGIPTAIRMLTQPAEGIENTILATDTTRKQFSSDGVPVETVKAFATIFSTPLAPLFPIKLLSLARSNDIVVHHAPFPVSDISLPWLPKHVGLVVYWHADVYGHPLLGRLIKPLVLRTLRRADRIIVSDAKNITTSKILSQFIGKCTVVPFGIDFGYWSTFSDDERRLSAALKLKYPRMILTVARLVSYKGIPTLLQAIKDVDCHLMLIGDGPLRKKLQDLTVQLGVADKVTFAGHLSTPEVKACMGAAKALVLPSVTAAETFGIVQVEAMASGLPVINTALRTGAPEVARNEREGLTVPPSDPVALAEAIERLLGDPILASKLGDAGRRRAQAEFGSEKYLLRIKTVYADVLQSRNTGEQI